MDSVCEHFVVSNVLVGLEAVFVDFLVLFVDDIQRKLSESVVDSVVEHTLVSKEANESQVASKEPFASISIEKAIGIEAVSLINTTVSNHSLADSCGHKEHAREHVEGEQVEAVQVVHLANESSHVSVNSNHFNKDLAAVELFLGNELLIEEDFNWKVRSQVEHRGKSVERDPNFRGNSGGVCNITVVSRDVSSTNQLFGSTS
mmetsp:Transcript_23435/g.32747  ORF Transcript_23435/g.32747 Transcript_23435/m.32747 type:complete len:203 (+) Transcript_23435:1904-2512(+)